MIILLVLLMKLRIKITLDGLCMNTLLQILVLVPKWSGLTNFSIKLGDDNNTNIARSDIIPSNPSGLGGGTHLIVKYFINLF